MAQSTVLIAHNLRSAHNVGSLLRTAEGLGLKSVYLTGYTPYPIIKDDPRLPHIRNKIDMQIHKTALDAEKYLDVTFTENIESVINELRQDNYSIVGLELDNQAVDLKDYRRPNKLALLVGREVEGIEPEVLEQCDQIIQIPMRGQKESFNVVQAAAIALYTLTN
ncbi:MAG TPA: TrmH family RNA methyltransferase [Candidatus Saccharimonadales bacterium]|nr:TrmH family RNA methyltransferase [Candidatus Saccharimonadales bacterium]